MSLDLLDFIGASPSPFHAAAEAARRLDAAGFTAVSETDAWPSGGRQYVVRGGSLVAWDASVGSPLAPFRIVGAHTDSPNLRIRPQPDTGRAGFGQLAVEIYGGVLLNSWLDRDLGLWGHIALRDDAPRLLRVDRPVLRVPQLAIHLDREIITEGLRLNPQLHLAPVWSLAGPEPDGFRRFVAAELGVSADDVLAWDVMTHDLAPGCLSGRDGEFLSSARLDNLCSCWAAIEALTEGAGTASGPVVVCLFDHEEVGSVTDTGAQGPLLRTVLERVAMAGDASREDFHRSLAGSVCVSADMAHATHPNYTERHEPNHLIAMNAGPVIKSNVNARYATDAPGAGLFIEACDRAGVPHQRYAHRNDTVCGSTIGPITAARLGITVVDVGAPQLAMHSAREMMGSADPDLFRRALAAFLYPG